MLITITNEHANVFLKQPRLDELDYVAWLWADERTMKSVGGPVVFSEDRQQDWYKRIVHPGDGRNFYCLIYTNDNEKVGEVSFHQFDETDKTAQFNVKVAYDHRGNGYGREAVLLLLDYFFHMFGGEKIQDQVAVNNIDAQKLLNQCGFDVISTDPEAVLYEITKDRFEEKYGEGS